MMNIIRHCRVPKIRSACSKIRYDFKGLKFSTSATQQFKEEPRVNPVGIQHLSKRLHEQVFPGVGIDKTRTKEERRLIELSKESLKDHNLLGKKTAISEPISFELPKLQGANLDEHFRRIALFSSENYLDIAKKFAKLEGGIPKRPSEWLFQSGWTKYPSDGSPPHKVEYPNEKAIVFDVETLYKVSQYAVMATAASETAWYGWVSPILTGDSKSFEHLIPLNTISNECVIIGHNVGYDRARIAEEYNLKESKAFFLDTMALHIASSGMCSRQRPKWMHHKKLSTDEEFSEEELLQSESEDPWVTQSSPNSLAEVANLYFRTRVDKEPRDMFGGEDIQIIKDNFQYLMEYCASDVATTFSVFTRVFPQFLITCPHPVSFAALKFMGSGVLTTNKTWHSYIETAENLYLESKAKIEEHLLKLVEEAVKLKDKPELFTNDPWLNQLDWALRQPRLTKKGEPYKRQRLVGYPEWYREICQPKSNKIVLSTRSRIVPILFKLTWEGYPVIWSDIHGWSFKAPIDGIQRMKDKNYKELKNFRIKKPETEEEEEASKEMQMVNEADSFGALNDDKEKVNLSAVEQIENTEDHVYFKVPNVAGSDARTALLLAKGFASFFEKGILSSDSSFAKEALDINASCSYWISARERIKSQFVIPKTNKYSIILPQVVTMGTVTRRAVEKTWLTASNAKKSRIGSELKSKIIAPPGYCLVGADVDSEELWIASLVGDSMFKLHGGTAIGWMTLEGTKNEGTDLHSKTAEILGISRNEAKIFNYGRIYGAGLRFATRLLKQFNPKLTDRECEERASSLYQSTKGQSGCYFPDKKRIKLWHGGTESVLFNRLESIAELDSPKTPVLGAGITKALLKQNLNSNKFLPSRVNWAIQSSGVDYLHLLCVSMNYLIKSYGIDARLSISVHDEIRYLVKEKDKYRAALALQISNLWTRAIFCERLGITDVPQSCAFFSAVDIDHVLRKEVDMDCITPSNPIPIPPGESLNINKLLNKEESTLGKVKRLFTEKVKVPEQKERQKDAETKTGNFSIENPKWKDTYLKMQIARTAQGFIDVWRNYEDVVLFGRGFDHSSFAEPTRRKKKVGRVPPFSPNIVDSFLDEQTTKAQAINDSKPQYSKVSNSPFAPAIGFADFRENPAFNGIATKTRVPSFKRRNTPTP